MTRSAVRSRSAPPNFPDTYLAYPPFGFPPRYPEDSGTARSFWALRMAFPASLYAAPRSILSHSFVNTKFFRRMAPARDGSTVPDGERAVSRLSTPRPDRSRHPPHICTLSDFIGFPSALSSDPQALVFPVESEVIREGLRALRMCSITSEYSTPPPGSRHGTGCCPPSSSNGSTKPKPRASRKLGRFKRCLGLELGRTLPVRLHRGSSLSSCDPP